jgi:hypothetical protein
MNLRRRVLFASLLLLGIISLVLGVDQLQRWASSKAPGAATPLPPGSLPIYMDGQLLGGFSPTDLQKLEKVSFTDAEEGKLQEGWLLSDIILLYVPADHLKPDTVITVISSSRGKSALLTWAEVRVRTNMVMFDLSNRGTLKLVSQLPTLNTREKWIQDADRIEIKAP